MGVIIHRCTVCAHPSYVHKGRDCSYGNCQHGAHDFTPGPSEHLPTYDGRGHVLATLSVPGTQYTGFGRYTEQLCGCDECRALFGRLAGELAW